MIAASKLAASIAILATGNVSNVDVRPLDTSSTVIIEGQTATVPGAQAGAVGVTPVPPTTCYWSGAARVCPDGISGARAAAVQDPATAAEIRRAVESVGLPALSVQIQPGGRTLVNVPTIFFVDAPTFQHSTVLLGQAVDITATPARFTWHHGDGSSQTTRRPGAPYPSTDVTHTYSQVADGLAPRVDVGYRVTYRVNGGEVLTVDQLVTAAGPAAALDVSEARPVIVAP